MDVLKNILTWSRSRPAWQRDALRRLVTTGPLTKTDIDELTEQCKATHGLAEGLQTTPLEAGHLPNRGVSLKTVNLRTLVHHQGVNALAPDQKIQFGPALTVVYGKNAAGKSGYTRILKRACRARGSETILGNVLVQTLPARPSASIEYTVGETQKELAWADQEHAQEDLGRVSVFDSRCASVYLTEKTDVAFRPFGLDLFDKLSEACGEIKDLLEKEHRELANRPARMPILSEGTAAQRLVSSITSLTKPAEVAKLAELSSAEKQRVEEIKKRMNELHTDDSTRTARILNLRAQKIESLRSRLAAIDEVLGANGLATLSEALGKVRSAKNNVETLHNKTFHSGLLQGTGAGTWRRLWESAREFSKNAYPAREFPVTDRDAKCLLCQQRLSAEAAGQLRNLEEFLRSNAQRELDNAQDASSKLEQRINKLLVADATSRDAVLELQIENELVAKEIQLALNAAQLSKDQVIASLANPAKLAASSTQFDSFELVLSEVVKALNGRAHDVLQSDRQASKDKLNHELRELEDRATLGVHLRFVLEEIERKKKLAAYRMALQDTHTQMITRKSTEVTKVVVTEQLTSSFKQELEKLRFTHLDVELQPTGGERGSLYHKVVLQRAVGADLPRVVSEGEARTLSIAAFFAELATATDRSAILFDDPVSSLDHDWRENVARRLVEECKGRQVIVFTHDIVFLLALQKLAEDMGVDCHHQYIVREHLGAGVSASALPWVAMKIKERIGVLKDMWQHADKTFRTISHAEYEREAVFIYGRLREAWERGLEEVLLGGIVERYRPTIQTQHADYLSDISNDDCKNLDAGMTKCSRWLPGHDLSPAENAPVPEPQELRSDIEALEAWAKAITKRRKKVS